MKEVLLVGGGFLFGIALMSRLKPAPDSSCCRRVALGARGVIAEKAGPFGSVVSGLLDGLGITDHLPSLLDVFGVPHDA